jgi:hypothetical protein
MVVWFDDKEKNAKLSLRQSEILAQLKLVEDEIRSKLGPDEYVHRQSHKTPGLIQRSVLYLLFSTQSMAAICSSRPPAHHTLVLLAIYCQWRATCDTGAFCKVRI